MTHEAAVTQMLADYYSAFSTLDVQAILPYFHYPALLMGPSGIAEIPASSALTAIFAPAMEELRNRGYGRSELSLQEVKLLGDTKALASGIAVRYKTDGQELERAGISYLLQKVDTGWKIAVIVLHA